MQNDLLALSLWTEKPSTQNKDGHPSSALSSLSYDFQEKHQADTSGIVSAWCLLLHQFSGQDALETPCLLDDSLYLIKSDISTNPTISAYLSDIKNQLSGKPLENKDNINTQYLLTLTKKPTSVGNQALAFSFYKNKFTIQFSENYFDSKSIKQLYDYFLLIFLTQNDKSNNSKISTVFQLTPEDKNNILDKWCKPSYPFKITPINDTIQQLVHEFAKKNPNKIAITHNDIHINYQQLQDASTHILADLFNKNVQIGDRICVLMDRSPLLIATMLAIMQAGCVYVPINPNYPEARINYIIQDSKATLIVSSKQHGVLAKNQTDCLFINPKQTDIFNLKNPSRFPSIHNDPANIAYMIYTSGTTGNPKGVMIQHQSLQNLIAWYCALFRITEEDRSSQFASQAFDTSLCEIIPFLGVGASIHIVDDEIKLTPSDFFKWLAYNQITVSDLPTAYAQVLFEYDWPTDLSLRILKIGGESINHYPKKDFNFEIWNTYGPTEATIETTFYRIHPRPDLTEEEKTHAPPIGKPINLSDVYIVDTFLEPVPQGVTGELLIGGNNLALGYFERDDLNKQKFIPHIFEPNKKLYKTGDLVKFNEKGEIEFVGRIDHQIKIRGHRIELGEIEVAISQHSDVSEVTLIAEKENGEQHKMIAYIVPNKDKQRYPYQTRCYISLNNREFNEVITEDISKQGVAISGSIGEITNGQTVTLHLTLPGSNDISLIFARIIWHQHDRTGLMFLVDANTQSNINRSIDHLLSSHNVMELLLSAAAKRSLKRALQKELPNYMLPDTFVTMAQFPLTFSGKIDTKALPKPKKTLFSNSRTYVPAKTNTEKQLETIWQKLLGKTEISMTDNFFDIGGHSISAAELSLKILDVFKISMPASIIFDLPYIPILAEYIDSNGTSYSNQSDIQKNIESDTRLQEDITPTRSLSPYVHAPKHILLTGAGGFLGIYLLRELLNNTDAKIYCLIRKAQYESPIQRLKETAKKFGLDNDLDLTNRRITYISSDLSFNMMGLSGDQYDYLSKTVDIIFHCAAQVSIMASYQSLRDSNVQGTLELIKFATRLVDKPIHYVSTLSSAVHKNAAGAYSETFPTGAYSDLFAGYAITKWVSERLLTQLKDRGLPVSIYRLGYVAGHSEKGIGNLNDALLMLIKGCIQLGCAPTLPEKITILPVDFVSHALIKMGLQAPDTSAVYHIDHPTGIMWIDLVNWLQNYGYHLELISLDAWQKKLPTLTTDNALYPFLPYYLNLKEDYKSPDVDTALANSKLKVLNLSYPEISDSLLTVYINQLIDINFLPQPAKAREKSKT